MMREGNRRTSVDIPPKRVVARNPDVSVARTSRAAGTRHERGDAIEHVVHACPQINPMVEERVGRGKIKRIVSLEDMPELDMGTRKRRIGAPAFVGRARQVPPLARDPKAQRRVQGQPEFMPPFRDR